MKYDPIRVRRFAESLKNVSQIKNLPVDLLEKDIWITYILRELRSLSEAENLVFKGGTCLVKAYFGYYRFSEDIDLTWIGPKVQTRAFRNQVLVPVMNTLSLEWYKHDKAPTGIAGTHSGGIMSYFLLSPPTELPRIKLKVTVAFDEKLVTYPSLLGLRHVPLKDTDKQELSMTFGNISIGYFDKIDFLCHKLQEIACEKIRAILTRKIQFARSRDLVDLFKIANGRKIEKVAPSSMVITKINSAVKVQSYRKEYRRTSRDLGTHLKQLASESQSDQVFLEKVTDQELTKFATELEEYLRKDILRKIEKE
ncbi:MAG: nucleotidyl transferase AbiEii/AbiGii toxin family protein [Candidatus Bathyarchaeia archaeon]